MNTYNGKLVILCPPHLSTKYGGAIADLFTTDNNLQLPTPMENYSRIEEGEQSKFYDFFKGSGVTITPRRVGFSINISDQRFEIRLALEELVALSLSTGYRNYTPITVHDHIRPEWQDYTQGYTVRVGKIEGFEDGSKGGGTRRDGYKQCDGVEIPNSSKLFGGGFRFRFLERNQRLIA